MAQPNPPAAPSKPKEAARSAPSRPAQGGHSPRKQLASPIDFKIETGIKTGATRIGIYGPGGIGKSTLAAYLPKPLFIDLEHGTRRMPVARIDAVRDFEALRGTLAALEASPPKGIETIVIDSLSVVEELAKDKIVETRKAESKGQSISVDSVDAFPWGKGWGYVYDEMMAFFADLDRIVDRHGLNVACIAHECQSIVANPYGEDYLRYEPHLYGGDRKERSSTRRYFINLFCDELLFIGYDVHATASGKGQGSGTRTVYTGERPTHLAKSRGTQTEIPFDLNNAADVWKTLGIS